MLHMCIDAAVIDDTVESSSSLDAMLAYWERMKTLFLDFAQSSLQNILGFIVIYHHLRLFGLVKFMTITLFWVAGLLLLH